MSYDAEYMKDREPKYKPGGYDARKVGDIEPGALVLVFPARTESTPFNAQTVAKREIENQPRNPQVAVKREGSDTFYSLGGGTAAAQYGSGLLPVEGVDTRKLVSIPRPDKTQS